jgi:hypothetical protein
MSGQLHAPAALLSTKQLMLPIEQEPVRVPQPPDADPRVSPFPGPVPRYADNWPARQRCLYCQQ